MQCLIALMRPPVFQLRLHETISSPGLLEMKYAAHVGPWSDVRAAMDNLITPPKACVVNRCQIAACDFYKEHISMFKICSGYDWI